MKRGKKQRGKEAEKKTVLFFLCFLLLCFSASYSSTLQSAEPLPAQLQNVGIEPKLGAVLPLDLEFTNEVGEKVALQNYFNQNKPILLTLVYYECPNLCNYLLNGMLDGLKKLNWTVDKEFDVVAVSINPKETPDLALRKKENYLKEYARPESEKGWHFLVGSEAQIQTLAKAIGFSYRYDEELKQYAHAAGLFMVTPQGQLARFLGGIQFKPRDLRFALVEASAGNVGTVVDKLLLFCYGYDAKANRYVLFANNLMKIGGAATIFALGLLVLKLGRKTA